MSGDRLVVSADMLGAQGSSVRVGALGVAGLNAAAAVPITANCSDASVTFSSGRTFAELKGQDVALEIVVEGAMVYTVGFFAEA